VYTPLYKLIDRHLRSRWLEFFTESGLYVSGCRAYVRIVACRVNFGVYIEVCFWS